MARRLLKIAYPTHIDNQYKKLLTDFTEQLIKSVDKSITAFLAVNVDYRQIMRTDLAYIKAGQLPQSQSLALDSRCDDFDSDFSALLNAVNVKLAAHIKRVLSKLPFIAKRLNEFNFISFKSSTQSLGKILQSRTSASTDKLIQLWIRENVNLIESIPRNLLFSVERVISDSINLGNTHTSLASNLQKQFNISRNRALLIARDQIAKLNGNLTRQRNLDLGITRYVWLSARDERVRHSHRVLEGKLCQWEDPTIYSNAPNGSNDKFKQRTSIGGAIYHPGQDIQCRCTSISVIDEAA